MSGSVQGTGCEGNSDGNWTFAQILNNTSGRPLRRPGGWGGGQVPLDGRGVSKTKEWECRRTKRGPRSKPRDQSCYKVGGGGVPRPVNRGVICRDGDRTLWNEGVGVCMD